MEYRALFLIIATVLSYLAPHASARILDSELGRWTRRNPLGFRDSLSRSQYASSRPIERVHPMGLDISNPSNSVACHEHSISNEQDYAFTDIALRLLVDDPPGGSGGGAVTSQPEPRPDPYMCEGVYTHPVNGQCQNGSAYNRTTRCDDGWQAISTYCMSCTGLCLGWPGHPRERCRPKMVSSQIQLPSHINCTQTVWICGCPAPM